MKKREREKKTQSSECFLHVQRTHSSLMWAKVIDWSELIGEKEQELKETNRRWKRKDIMQKYNINAECFILISSPFFCITYLSAYACFPMFYYYLFFFFFFSFFSRFLCSFLLIPFLFFPFFLFIYRFVAAVATYITLIVLWLRLFVLFFFFNVLTFACGQKGFLLLYSSNGHNAYIIRKCEILK